jgi:hypothetical protein
MSGWEHVNEGDPWTPPNAQTHNAMLDVAKEGRGHLGMLPADQSSVPWQSLLMLENTTGDELLGGDVVAIRDNLGEPTDDNSAPWQHPVPVGVEPEWPDDAGRLAVAIGNIGDEKLGYVAVSGLVVAKVQVVDTEHRWVWYAEDINGFKTGTGGQAKIIGKVPDVGTDKYVLIDLSREQPLWEFVTEDDPYGSGGGSGSGSIIYKLKNLHGEDGDETEQEFELTDPFDYFERIDEGQWTGHVQWIDDKFVPAGAPCTKPSTAPGTSPGIPDLTIGSDFVID